MINGRRNHDSKDERTGGETVTSETTRGRIGERGWTVRMDERMEKVLYGGYGRGEASFYRGRHLPTDRHYRAK